MPHLTIGNHPIHFDRYLSDARKALVFIHGAGGSSRHWPNNLGEIAEAVVYCIDLPGHGRSGGAGFSTMDAYADVVAAFSRELGCDRIVLAGHSMGGGIVQTLALRSPEWMTAAILVGTGSRLRVHPSILEGSKDDFERTVDGMPTMAFGPNATPGHIDMFKQQIRSAGSRVVHGDFTACDRFDIGDRLAEIQLPVLVVSGTDDRLTPVKYGQFLHERIAGSRFVRMDGAGHMMALEKPEEFVAAVRNFLRLLP